MITQYGLRLDVGDNGHPYLLKEREVEYATEGLVNPEAIVSMCNTCFHLAEMAEEYLIMVVMDSAGHPLGVFELSHGTVRETVVGVREIMIRILLCGGVSAVLVHNHPSSGSSPEPSKEDRTASRRLQEAGKLMGIVIPLDFIIIGRENFYSFKRNNLL